MLSPILRNYYLQSDHITRIIKIKIKIIAICKEGYNRLTYMTQPKRSNENPMSNRRVGLNFLKSQIGVESKSIKQENCIDRGNPRRHRRRKSREKSGMRDHLGGLGRRGWVGLPSPQRIWIGIGIGISPFVGEEEREREVIL